MRYLCALLLAFACVSLSQTASAQISIVPYIGYGAGAGANLDESPRYFDAKGAFFGGIGLELGMPLEGSIDLKARPSIEYYLLSDYSETTSQYIYTRTQNRLQINADMIAGFHSEASIAPYVGAGVFWSRWAVNQKEERANNVVLTVSESHSGLGVNFLAGAQMGAMGFGSPFVEIRYRYQFWGVEDTRNPSYSDPKELHFNGFSIAAGVSIPLGN